MTWVAGTAQDAIERWALVEDGPALRTPSSVVQPVIDGGRPAILKVAAVSEEAAGAFVLAAWDGVGAAEVYRLDEHAVVLERATGRADLTIMSGDGHDLEAVDVLCRTARSLHAASPDAVRRLTAAGHQPTGLREWFGALERRVVGSGGAEHGTPVRSTHAHSAHDEFLQRAWTVAETLLTESDPDDERLLHGDLHHGNVLEFAPGDWRAIDPKSVVGDRAFDYAAMFGNPDARIAADPELFLDRVTLVSIRSGVPRRTLLQWIIAWAGLSAAWSLEDDSVLDADAVIGIGRLADVALWASPSLDDHARVSASTAPCGP
ncbi:aminoglycoside phosphotransferase family protein [Plantibacter sp. Mn2098]|uniref:aminoglycoside phosphotransferase family protein n=1 Tax=Plantibacter sp. Mn2098 TaxID=3395266 RepID=UPI003BD541C4